MASIKKRIAEGVFFGGVSNVVIKLFAAAGYFFVLRRLSLHDYGVFAFLISLAAPVGAIVLFSFDRIFVSSFALALSRQQWSRMKGLYTGYLKTSALLAVICLLLAFLFKELLSEHYNIYLSRYFWPLCIFVLGQISLNLVQLFLEGCQAFKQNSIIGSFESIIRTVFIAAGFVLLPAFSVGFVILSYAFAKLAAAFLGMGFVIRLYRRYFPSGTVSEKGVMKEVFAAYGKWDTARNLIEQLIAPIKLFIIKLFVSIEGVAVYDFARNVYGFATGMFPMKKVMFPIIAGAVDRKEILLLIIEKAKKYMMIIYSGLFICALIFTPIVVRLLFPQYIGQEYAVYLVMLHLFVDVYKIEQDALLYAAGKQKFLLGILPFFTTLIIILDIIFVKWLGIAGSIISWHIFALLNGAILGYFVSKFLKIPAVSWRQILRYDDYDRMIVDKIFKRLPFIKRWSKDA